MPLSVSIQAALLVARKKPFSFDGRTGWTAQPESTRSCTSGLAKARSAGTSFAASGFCSVDAGRESGVLGRETQAASKIKARADTHNKRITVELTRRRESKHPTPHRAS